MKKSHENRIFVSYSRDDLAFAAKLVQELRQRGYTAWFDKDNARAGSDFVLAIEEGVSTSSNFLLILTPSSVASPWVTQERSMAFQRSVTDKEFKIIPILREDCEVPATINKLTLIDFTSNEEHVFQARLQVLLRELPPPYRYFTLHSEFFERAFCQGDPDSIEILGQIRDASIHIALDQQAKIKNSYYKCFSNNETAKANFEGHYKIWTRYNLVCEEFSSDLDEPHKSALVSLGCNADSMMPCISVALHADKKLCLFSKKNLEEADGCDEHGDPAIKYVEDHLKLDVLDCHEAHEIFDEIARIRHS